MHLQNKFVFSFLFVSLAFAVSQQCSSTQPCTRSWSTLACYNNNDCEGFNSRCYITSGILGVCKPGFPAGHECAVDTDCNVLNGLLCTNKICETNGVTAAGASCQNDNQCNNQIYSRCSNGQCVTAGGFGASCLVDQDCSRLSLAKWCLGGKCMVQNAGPCLTSAECGDPISTQCGILALGPTRYCCNPADTVNCKP